MASEEVLQVWELTLIEEAHGVEQLDKLSLEEVPMIQKQYCKTPHSDSPTKGVGLVRTSLGSEEHLEYPCLPDHIWGVSSLLESPVGRVGHLS